MPCACVLPFSYINVCRIEEHPGAFICCRSTVLMTTCYWPSSHCIPAHKFVSLSAELNQNHWQWVLDSNKVVCCHHLSSALHCLKSKQS